MGDLESFEINFLFDPSADEENDSCFLDSSAEAEDDCLVDIHLHESGTTLIPPDLIARKPEAYKPHTISLGPLHFDDFQLKDYEEKKKQLLQDRFPYRVRDFKKLVDSMIVNLSRIRQWYPISDSFPEAGKLGSMMALDGIFLLQFLSEIYPMSDVEKNLSWMKIRQFANLKDFSDLEKKVSPDLRKQLQALTVQQVQEDIMKLRNQIPLFVLGMILHWERKTYETMKQSMLEQKEGKGKDKMLQDMMHQVRTGTNKNLVSILSRAWHCLSPFPDMDINEDRLILPGENAHILGFVYANILGDLTDRTQCNGKGKKKNLPARAVVLDSKGVKFAAYTGPLNKIHFDSKTWTFHLPRIEITERTDAVMRNLVAFELFGCEGQTKPIKCYVELMDQLINTAEDVEVLKKRGIINHHLGTDQEVADIWNKMREGHDQKGKYGPIDTAIDEVIKLYGSHRIWYAEGVKRFFSKPWLVVSFIAGCIIVVTAILQTIFSGLQLHHP